jgi:3',5'-cyclic AMP phosphodiesterase CpdA
MPGATGPRAVPPALARGRRVFLERAALGGAALLTSVLAGRSASASSGSELRLALLSDTHVPGDRQNGHRGMNPWEHLRAASGQVAAARPEGVVICGDIARLEGREEDYRELRALLEPVSAVAPVYLAPGNHDDRAALLKVFPERPGRPVPVEGRLATVVEHDAVRVVVLDSLLYVNRVAGLLGRAQRTWLSGFLQQAADRPAVLFVHHPPTDEDGDLLDGDRLLGIVRAHPHVKAIFHGHAHVWSIGRRDRLAVVGLPALGYNFDDAQPVGWVDARFRRDGVSLTLRTVAGNRADEGKETFLAWPA